MIRREYSYIIAAVIWSILGINITVNGVKSYLLMSPDELWWLLSITAIVAVFFYFIYCTIFSVDFFSFNPLGEAILRIIQLEPACENLLLVL